MLSDVVRQTEPVRATGVLQHLQLEPAGLFVLKSQLAWGHLLIKVQQKQIHTLKLWKLKAAVSPLSGLKENETAAELKKKKTQQVQ